MIIDTCGSRFVVDASTGYPGYWDDVGSGRWEPETLAALGQLIEPGTRFVDIGAWIGPTTLFAAAAGATVHCYEPDSVAVDGLRSNLSRNPELEARITVHPYALASESGTATLSAPELGQSVSSLVSTKGDSQQVELVAFHDAVDRAPFTDAEIVKMDIEGGEYALLSDLGRYLQRSDAVLILSTHVQHLRERLPAGLPRPARLVGLQLLALSQLRIAWHLRNRRHWYVPDGTGWRRVSRFQVLSRLARFSDKEFIVSARPLSLPAPG